MNPSPPPHDPSFNLDVLLSWVLLIGLSLWGGVASFIRKMKEGHARAWNFTELLGELVVAGFTGIITANLCDYMAAPPALKYALVGIAAHMGSRALFKLEGVLNTKFNLPADAPAPTKESGNESHQ
ncbi:LydA family holin superfamily III [Pseudoduganella lurida]|uniref:LydA family holin superfamily III n=1 Tax=Pseudoduganella lurida TaxID=1036180 RepID=A0A562RJ14_9BURK|nr:phage holin family protein [Pseudoduganella lurida]TWI69067.1 LydA family holin superfamily III [Pseudoduganella lurida]